MAWKEEKNEYAITGLASFMSKDKRRLQLSPRDTRIADLYVRGLAKSKIAEIVKVSAKTVFEVLKKEDVAHVIASWYDDAENDRKALKDCAINVLRESMSEEHDMTIRLQGAKLYWQTEQAFLKNAPELQTETAEDIMQRILNMNINVNVNTNGTPDTTEIKVINNTPEEE